MSPSLIPRNKSEEASYLLSQLKERMVFAENRFTEELNNGSNLSIASTRASYLAWKNAVDLVEFHLARMSVMRKIEILTK